jgi:hypothetical protein
VAKERRNGLNGGREKSGQIRARIFGRTGVTRLNATGRGPR